MHEVVGFVRDYSVEFILVLSFLSLILLVYSIALSARLAAMARRRNSRIEGGNVSEIVDYITDQSDALVELRARLDEVWDKQHELDCTMASCVRKCGLVRFNAFDDVGGDQSFALALLDGRDNGVVMSSLYGRHDSRLYIKGITNGEGERALSDEERRALRDAQSHGLPVSSI